MALLMMTKMSCKCFMNLCRVSVGKLLLRSNHVRLFSLFFQQMRTARMKVKEESKGFFWYFWRILPSANAFKAKFC